MVCADASLKIEKFEIQCKKLFTYKYFERIDTNAEMKKMFFIRILQAIFASSQQFKSVTFEDRLENIS